jgi:hypothetical protein
MNTFPGSVHSNAAGECYELAVFLDDQEYRRRSRKLTDIFKYRKIALDKSCFVCYYNKALRGQVLHRNTGDAGKMLV